MAGFLLTKKDVSGYNTHMKNATIRPGVNEFEAIQVGEYMEKRYPNVHYTMTPGNNCIWVYFGNQNWYFIFKDGKIADVQID